MKVSLLILLVSIFFLFSCKKIVSCLEKTTGQTVNELAVAHYNEIVLEGKVNLMLAYGENKTTLEADGSFVDDVVWRVENETLKVSYNPTCKTLKDREVVLNVSSKEIDYINHRGQGVILSKNRLLYNKLFLELEEKYVRVELDLEVNEIGVAMTGVGDIRLKGRASFFWVSNYAGDNYMNTSDMYARDVVIDHNGTNRIVLYADKSLKAKLSSSGDIILHHVPLVVTEEKSNTGRVRYQ